LMLLAQKRAACYYANEDSIVKYMYYRIICQIWKFNPIHEQILTNYVLICVVLSNSDHPFLTFLCMILNMILFHNNTKSYLALGLD
jgi:hypothetical protein